MLGECPSHASEDHLTHNYNVNDISSNSWGINRCEEYATSATDCPFECPSVSSADCPCDACDGDDWASGDLSTCEDAVVDYCTNLLHRRRDALFGARPLLRRVRLLAAL